MITQEYLKSILHYDPETGVFTWVKRRSGVTVGMNSGSERPDGYVNVTIDGGHYYAHRLAFFYMFGRWPVDQLDHINNHRSDNRICNLRECSQTQNKANSGIQKNNKTGYKGVSWCRTRKKYLSQIRKDKKTIHIGYFDNKTVAAESYNKRAIELFGEFALINKMQKDCNA